MRMQRIRIQIRLSPDADPPDPDASLQIKAKTPWKSAQMGLIFHIVLQINADLDPAYHFGADPDFYLMRIQVTKLMRIHNTVSKQYRNSNYS